MTLRQRVTHGYGPCVNDASSPWIGSPQRRFALLAVAAAAFCAGCSSLDRSRNLNNPAVPPQALAQQVCSICHGIDGNATSPNFPNLAGQQEQYLIAQLTEFRDKKRSDPAGFEYMWGLSRHLTDDQIKGLAGYYAVQKPVPLPASDSGQMSEGESIFANGVPGKNVPACHTCHGQRGEGNGQFPRIADQHADYLFKQLMVFQRTDERPEGSVMKTIAHDMTRENMKAVAAYLQGMPR
jgi:cytochrome c553